MKTGMSARPMLVMVWDIIDAIMIENTPDAFEPI
jgi:hypothetical protein